MNKSTICMGSLLLPILAAGCSSNGGGSSSDVIPPPSVEIKNRMVSPEVLAAFGRINEAAVSPDGKSFAFTLSYEDINENSSNADIYLAKIDGSDLKQLTATPKSEANIRWIDGGNKIAFLGLDKTTEKTQVFVMNADGTGRQCVSAIKRGVTCFEISPDGSKIVFGSSIDAQDKDSTLFAGLPNTTGRVVNDLMYKHWDEWVTDIPHPFLADFSGNKVENEFDMMEGEPYECPMKPFGGAETFAWAPDSKSLVYVCRKLTGKEYAYSTNSDIYLYDVASKKTVANLSEGNEGYDTDPKFSPDGKSLAWLSMKTPSYESDKKRLVVMDMATRKLRDLTENWDYWPEGLAWNGDSKSIVFNAYYQGTEPVFRIDVESCKIDTLATGMWDYVNVEPIDNNRVLALRHSMQRPNEVCVIENGNAKDVTSVNAALLSKLDLGKVEKAMVPTTDGKEMTAWVIYPPNFDPNKKYPMLLYCQGGPQSAVSQFFSYRWNFMIMAANGYIVIAPNRRGVPGFGEEWNRQISGDYGGQNMQDYLSAVDYMTAKPYVDADRVGAIGASYGGFSVYWLAGHNDGRFAALIAHAGIFNVEAQYLETEEMWFANFDIGGPFWEKDNATAQKTYENSPHRFIDKWTAPILITVGELDYRILASQGMMAFNAAKMRGLEAEMLVFPDENHWILKPQNAILWQRVFFRFLDKYLKNPVKKATAAPVDDNKSVEAPVATTPKSDNTEKEPINTDKK